MASSRRNGQPASCEPCRKSKLRCDHNTPTCERCIRRKKPWLCVYHPAPLTQQGPSGPPAASRPKKKRRIKNSRPSFVEERNSLHSISGPNDPAIASSYHPASIPIDRHIAEWSKRTTSSSTPGFLGLTSYSAVFSENESSLRVAAHGHDEDAGPRDSHLPSNSSPTAVDPRHIQLGAQLLSFLQDISLYQKIAEIRYHHGDGWLVGKSHIGLIFSSVERTYDALLEEYAGDLHAAMFAWSKQMSENVSKPIETTKSMSVQEYMALITGPNPRWEIIGLLFSLMGLGAAAAASWDPVFRPEGRPKLDKKELSVVATVAGDLCLQLCDNGHGSVSDPLSWLLFQHSNLLTLVYGDTDYRPWKRFGECCSVIFALGLHQSELDGNTPFFLAEHRKRIFAGAYSMDKQLATFLGRPPRICWRYCDVELPLDLDWDEIVAEPSVRQTAISKLDENGWNTDGSLGRASWTRVALLMGYIREDVLELSLNRQVKNLPQTVEEISQNNHDAWNSLPSFLRYQTEQAWPEGEDHDAGLRLTLYLDYLYNDFLLYRILAKRTETRSESLISVSRKMQSALLHFLSRVSPFARMHCDSAWNVCCYGLPAAGVLAIELLFQSQQIHPPPPPSFQSQTQSPFSRSEVIQELSVFASHLESVNQPHEGNYDICQQARKAIRHILDRVLSSNPLPVPSIPPENQDHAAAIDWLGTGSVFDDSETDFLKWIDNLDWIVEPWNGFG